MQNFRATRLLRDDHKTIRGLFTQLTAASLRTPEMVPGVEREVFMHLEVHMATEEQLIYSKIEELLARYDNPEIRGLLNDSQTDHEEVRNAIQSLRALDPGSAEFRKRFEELIQLMVGHMDEEELVLYPFLEKAAGPALDLLGNELERMRSELMSAPQYRDALAKVVQNPRGGEQIRKDTGPSAA